MTKTLSFPNMDEGSMNELTNKKNENYIPLGINARGIINKAFLKDNVVAEPCLLT